MSFRWFGDDDPVKLWQIRQIPGVVGVVTALHNVPPGEVWPVEHIRVLREKIERHDLALTVVESVPVHEDIKLGLPSRDKYIENFIQTLHNLARQGVNIVCYNFMPVFDWIRTQVDFRLPDGSYALAYDEQHIRHMDPRRLDLYLPGWHFRYSGKQLENLIRAYEGLDEERLWENLTYFLRAVVPEAEATGVRLAVHPDDPPWPVFGLPRIIRNKENIRRLVRIYDSLSNGLCICTGSLGADPNNDVVDILQEFLKMGRVHFVHARNVRVTGERRFHETGHRTKDGAIDMYQVIRTLAQYAYDGPIRPDHGRNIWGEQGRPGYGLYDRALGVAYLNGLWEAVSRERADVPRCSETDTV